MSCINAMTENLHDLFPEWLGFDRQNEVCRQVQYGIQPTVAAVWNHAGMETTL